MRPEHVSDTARRVAMALQHEARTERIYEIIQSGLDEAMLEESREWFGVARDLAREVLRLRDELKKAGADPDSEPEEDLREWPV